MGGWVSGVRGCVRVACLLAGREVAIGFVELLSFLLLGVRARVCVCVCGGGI